jgi:hypothetical protein
LTFFHFRSQEQKVLAQRISGEVSHIKQDVAAAAGLSDRCSEAKIEWGDLEPIEDLEYEAQLLEDNIAAKSRFIDNGVFDHRLYRCREELILIPSQN